jgi:hypothetical protein
VHRRPGLEEVRRQEPASPGLHRHPLSDSEFGAVGDPVECPERGQEAQVGGKEREEGTDSVGDPSSSESAAAAAADGGPGRAEVRSAEESGECLTGMLQDRAAHIEAAAGAT